MKWCFIDKQGSTFSAVSQASGVGRPIPRLNRTLDQARQNLEKEIPNGQFLEDTARKTRAAWAERLSSTFNEHVHSPMITTFQG